MTRVLTLGEYRKIRQWDGVAHAGLPDSMALDMGLEECEEQISPEVSAVLFEAFMRILDAPR